MNDVALALVSISLVFMMKLISHDNSYRKKVKDEEGRRSDEMRNRRIKRRLAEEERIREARKRRQRKSDLERAFKNGE